MKLLQLALLACLAVAPELGSRSLEVEYTDVSYSSLKGMQDKKGRELDGSIKFYFADEGGPKSSEEEISARGSTFVAGDPERACRQALLAAFISFQERAKRDGAKAVVGMKTYADDGHFSKSRNKCKCRYANRVYTTVRGRLVGVARD